jgi:hypothetical protein
MRYMLLVYEPASRPSPGSPEALAVMEANEAFARECRRRGVFIAADPLLEAPNAKTVRAGEEGPLVTDGPFAETREWLAGYWMLDCSSEEEALELAALCPGCGPGRAIEVRPVLELPGTREIHWVPGTAARRAEPASIRAGGEPGQTV